MANETIHAGELNRQVEFFKNVSSKNSSNESVTDPQNMGKRMVKRVDVSGEEENEGKTLALSVCKFITRFSPDVLTNGTEYYIQDIDGKFQVNSVSITGPGRNRFLELKCSSRN